MKFHVIGIDDNKSQHFSPEVINLIQQQTIFSGGKRHREIVSNLLSKNAHWIDITIPLDTVFKEYERYEEIVVFASGDPLFFGFANTIQRKIPNAEIFLFPYFNSLQILAHRMLMPYQDMHIVSLTGRLWNKLDEALIHGYDKIGVLTDNKEHTPALIADRMLYYGYDNYTITIGEVLGNKEEEKVSTWKLVDVLGKKFRFPNNLILQKTNHRTRPFGISDNDFKLLNGRSRMITKMPIRLLSLNMLDLRDRSVLWDIGFCTGSVSIESKLQFPHLQIIAFEQRTEGLELINNNSRKFGTPGIVGIIDDFVETDISNLPSPDAVFIGGHGGQMDKIVSKIYTVLKNDGVIVFNSVSDNSKQMFLDALKNNNLILENSIAMQVDQFNLIEVMKAKK